MYGEGGEGDIPGMVVGLKEEEEGGGGVGGGKEEGRSAALGVE